MSEGKMFRSQIGGFNRDDVNNFIKDTDLKHTEERNALLEEITTLTARAEEASSTVSTLEEKLAMKDSTLQEMQLKLAEAEKTLADKVRLLTEKEAALVTKQAELTEAMQTAEHYKNESDSQSKVIHSQAEEIRSLNDRYSTFHTEAEQKLSMEKTHAADLEKSIENFKAQHEHMNAQLLDVQQALHNKTEALTCAESDKAALTAAKEALSALNDELEKKVSSLSEELNEIRLAAEKASKFDENTEDKDSPAYKIGMYDKISSQLGDILINANRSADDLVISAKEDAERLRTEIDMECEQRRTECDATVARIKAETEEEAAYIRERLSQTANELLEAVSSDLHASIENCVREINTSFTDIQYEFKTLLSKIASRSNEMNDRVNYYQSCVSDGIEEKLTAMDEKYGIRRTESGDKHND